MRRLPIVPFVLVLLTGSAFGEDAVRVMTYNIHHAEGTDGVLDVERIAGIIRAEKPDVVCLQEVDEGCERTEGIDMPAVLAEKLGMKVAFGWNLAFQGGHYGNALLTPHTIVSEENIKLPGPDGVEPRGCQKVVVRIGENRLTVFNTHLGLKASERAAQVDYILKHLGEGAAILCGDLNEPADAPGVSRLLERLSDTYRRNGEQPVATWGVGNPRARRIDFILVSSGIQVESSRVVLTPETKVASDHLPFVADLELTLPEEAN